MIDKCMQNNLLESCNYLLGQSLFDHDLVKGNHKVIRRIENCDTMQGIINILNKQHKKVYGRRKKLPGTYKTGKVVKIFITDHVAKILRGY